MFLFIKTQEAIETGKDRKETFFQQVGWMTGDWAHKLLENGSNRCEKLLEIEQIHDPFDAMRYFEIAFKLSEYDLARVDLMSMAHGLEVRVPYLRKEIVDIFLSYSSKDLLTTLGQKEILKKHFTPLLPNDWLVRKKQSFTAPFIQWLQRPLKGETYELLLGTSFHQRLGLKTSVLEDLLENR